MKGAYGKPIILETVEEWSNRAAIIEYVVSAITGYHRAGTDFPTSSDDSRIESKFVNGRDRLWKACRDRLG
ncbi:hypothetical protein D9M73_292760 [compost metagenome]